MGNCTRNRAKGAGHSVTLQTPIRFREHGKQRYSVTGTPTDCVLTAVRAIIKGPIDLVLSGVNRGGNIAEDITHSGNDCRCDEGTLCDIPPLHFRSLLILKAQTQIQPSMENAETHAPKIIKALLAEKWEQNTFFNVNFS